MIENLKEKKMNKFQQLSTQKPFLFTLLLVCSCIGLLYSYTLFNIENVFYRDIISSLIKNVITVALVVMLIKFKWLERSLLITPFKAWNAKWWLASLPMLIVALLNLTSIDFSLLSFNFLKAISWFYTNLSTGLFEEILLRGVCFTVLYAAWKEKENALIKAAICQALIFGLAHYVNLTKAPFLEVSVQVTYSTLIGIGFAGVFAYSKSLWPAIALHTLINACGSIGLYFQLDYIATQPSMTIYAMIIVIIAITCALPGYFLLKKANVLLVPTKLMPQ